ncbi:MAG TPA: hypothetical protein VGQ41_06625 [Pyrinomonadaceae bacterium]|jgi:hypothetical protein|nr:hypothetical protein [Pyrinomonadaceae bacterium]
MTRFLKIKALVLTLALLLGTVAVSGTERAFSSSGKGVATPIPTLPGEPPTADVTGTGYATHLGLFTNAGRISFVPDANDSNLVHPIGAATFTAANGDKLNIVVADSVMDLRTGVGTGHFSFAGGTGRFENASGITEFVVEQNFVSGAYEITMVGKIDY